jgi:hypothetical protein
VSHGEQLKNLRSVGRRVSCALAVVFLLSFAWWAVSNGLRGLERVSTLGQTLETVIQLSCGVLSVGVALTRFRWRPASRWVRIGWMVTLAGTVGLSALVWGPPMLHIALLFVVVSLLMASAVVWALGPGLPGG